VAGPAAPPLTLPLTLLARRRANRELAATAAALLALYWWVSGPGLAGTADSGNYLHAARSLRQVGRLLMPDGRPFAAWPPLFPVLLRLVGAPASLGLVRGLQAAGLVGALVGWSLVGRQLLSAGRARALPLLLALNAPALAASKFIWSETVFGLLWAAYFLSLLAWLRAGGWAWGLWATALGCLLPLQRVAGFFLLLGVGLGLAWPGSRRLVRPGRPAQLAHWLGSAAGLLAWQAYQGRQALLGQLDAMTATQLLARLLHSLADYGFVLGHWLLPLPPASRLALPPLAWALLGLAGLLGLAAGARARPVEVAVAGRADGPAQVAGRLLFGSLVVSLSLLLLSTMRGRAGLGLDEAERYFTPLFPPAALLLLLAWPRAGQLARLGRGLLLGSLLYQALRLGHNARYLHQLPPVLSAEQLPLPGQR